MQQEVEQWVRLSEAVAAGSAGKDYSVVEEELMGYERTPLEESLWKCAEALRERLVRYPEELTPELATAILQAALRCAPGIGGYRARLMAYAGDWGDETSPIADTVRHVVRGLGDALRALGPAAEGIRAGIPVEVLQAKLTLYYVLGAGERADFDYPIDQHLREEFL